MFPTVSTISIEFRMLLCLAMSGVSNQPLHPWSPVISLVPYWGELQRWDSMKMSFKSKIVTPLALIAMNCKHDKKNPTLGRSSSWIFGKLPFLCQSLEVKYILKLLNQSKLAEILKSKSYLKVSVTVRRWLNNLCDLLLFRSVSALQVGCLSCCSTFTLKNNFYYPSHSTSTLTPP